MTFPPREGQSNPLWHLRYAVDPFLLLTICHPWRYKNKTLHI